MNEYTKQAEDFLNLTGTIFKADFLSHDRYFPGDKDERDIYTITLARGSRKYTFTFGQSIVHSGDYYKPSRNGRVYFTAEQIAAEYGNPETARPFLTTKNNPYAKRLYLKKLEEEFNIYVNEDKQAPTAYDVLASVQKYNPGSFSEFCSEYGYAEDSKTAEKTYNAVKNEYLNIIALYNDAEIAVLAEII